MSSGRLKALTYRVENIPYGTTKEQLVSDYFYVKDQGDIKVKSLVPAVDTVEGEEGDYTATVLFHPHESRQGGPRVQDDSITVDRDFCGFTPLYVPPKEKGPIAADIIAVTGLAGHAFGSWAHSDEHMWLRDYLPRDIPNVRILTYGYYSKLRDDTTVNILQDHTNKFVHGLIDVREDGQCESRPIIFIGHSLGCLIIKKALSDAISLGITRSRLPVRGIIFLAPPHRGLDIDALRILVKGEPTEALIMELKSQSPTLTWLNQSFAQFARDIDILTCYENKPTNTVINVNGEWKREGPAVMMVTLDSARQYYPKEKLVSADSDHSQIARIMKGQNGIYPSVKSAIKRGLVSTARIVAGAGENNVESPSLEEQINTLQLSPSPPSYSRGDAIKSQFDVEPVAEFHPALISQESAGEHAMPMGIRDPVITSEHNRRQNLLDKPPATESYIEIQEIIPGTVSSNAVKIRQGENEENEADDDEELEKMIIEFDEMIQNSPAPYKIQACSRCDNAIVDSEYHYACQMCAKNSPETCVCQNCYSYLSTCRTHGVDMFKRIDKPWRAVYRWSEYLDPDVTETDDDMSRALKENDTAKVREYAQNSMLLNAHGHLMFTPLHIAAHLGLEESAQILLEHGALREAREYRNSTPLITAIDNNRTGMVKLLLENGARVDSICGVNSSTAMHCAAANGMSHIIAILIKHGATVDQPSGRGTPLRLAVTVGSEKSSELLLAAGANPNVKSEKVSPLLCIAAYDGRDVLVKLLLAYGAEADVLDNNGCTPLMYAAKKGHLEICKDLLERHADVNAQSTNGFNAITLAAQNGKEKMVKFLLERGSSGAPPRALTGKWKRLLFDPDVEQSARNNILSTLRAAKHG